MAEASSIKKQSQYGGGLRDHLRAAATSIRKSPQIIRRAFTKKDKQVCGGGGGGGGGGGFAFI